MSRAIAEKLAAFSDHWSPKVVARLNDYEIKVVKLEGELVWHSHADTDELFLVIKGELSIQFRDGDATRWHDSPRAADAWSGERIRSPSTVGGTAVR